MMALRYHIWLVLLTSVISQCGATEFFVKPTDVTTDTCPGQPCLTINEYANASSHYIKSNTVFTFLPGKHMIVRPIVIRDVENVSLTTASSKSDTTLISQYTCHMGNCTNDRENHAIERSLCCSVFRLINVSHASINVSIGINISIEAKLVKIIGLTIQRSYKVHIEVNVFCTGFPVQKRHISLGLALIHTIDTTICNSMLTNLFSGISITSGVSMYRIDTVAVLNTTIHTRNSHGLSIDREET